MSASCGRTRGNRVAGTNLANGSWTAERVALLRNLWGEGIPVAEIGRRLGITKSATGAKAHRLDLPDRRPPNPTTRLAAPPKRPEPPREQPQPVESGRGCAWIEGKPAGKNTVFCGEPCKPGSPYCNAHHRRCYAPQRKRDAGESAAA